MDELTVTFDALSLNGFFRILNLPLELFSGVCNHLDDYLLRRIRLVSRAFNDRSTFTFGIRFFTHLVAIPRPDSLAVLLRYAHDQKLSRFVRTVSLSGEIGGSPSIAYVGMPLSTAEDMLTEALRNFENLETIRTGSHSYLRLHYLSPEAIGIHCGPERLFSEQLRCDFAALSHLFQVMMESIERANICDKIQLDFNLIVVRPSTFNNFSTSPIQSQLFDLSLPFWKESLSLKVRKVEVVLSETSEWASNLAASGSELQELCLVARTGRVQFHNGHGGLHVWQHLQALVIYGVHINNTAIADFFNAHQGLWLVSN